MKHVFNQTKYPQKNTEAILSQGKWSNWISMPESNTKRTACQPVCLCRFTMMSRLKCDIKLHHRGNIFLILLTGLLLHAPTYTLKTLQDFTEPQEAECLFMEIWYACVCPAYSSFSSIFCLPGIFSRMSPHPTYRALLKIFLPHCATDHCFAGIILAIF